MIEIKGLKKSFGDLAVLKGIDLQVDKGEVVAIIGPSGTGKSTLLRCINLLERPSEGTIRIGDFTWDAKSHTRGDVYQLRAKTAMVFQNYNLFKNKTALQNIMEPMLVVQKMNTAEAEQQALAILKKVGLEEKRDVYPSKLSGGQQQRVGIGRAMAVHPELILFDEPTSSLDPELVGEVLETIQELARSRNTTMLITTHEMEFARRVANRVIFMAEGHILEENSAEEFFRNPQHERTKQFLSNYKV